MKNESVRRRGGGWLAVAVVAVFGVLAASLLAGAGASATGQTEEMEIVHRNYDWGQSRRGGQVEEDKHRKHLENQFKVWFMNQGDHNLFRVQVPSVLILMKAGLFRETVTVNYSIESIFHEYVENKADCDSKRSNSAMRLRDYEGRTTTTDVWVKSGIDNLGQHSCLTVKLKGDIPDGFDTHPEWVFVSPTPILEESITWPAIRIVSDERGARAYSRAGASGLKFYWKYRIFGEGGSCGWSSFAGTPNHPAVHHSRQFTYPQSQEARDYYRNRYICFQATIVNIDHPDYLPGETVYRHRAAPLNPPANPLVISVISRTVEDQRLSLEIDSSKAVTYRVGRLGNPLHYSRDGGCRKLFATSGSLRLPTFSVRKVKIIADKHRTTIVLENDGGTFPLCLEATDKSGSKVYTYVPVLWGDNQGNKISVGREMNE